MIMVLGHNYSVTDVDSVVSSMVLAEILRQSGQEAKAVLINPNAVQDTTREILTKAGIKTLPPLVSRAHLVGRKVALVDHNNPSESYGKWELQKRPVMIVDHHTDVGVEADEKIIRRVGSTCTILTQMARDRKIHLPNDLARALVYGIACDTKAFLSRKKTEADIEAAYYLYRHYPIGVDLKQVGADVLTVTNLDRMTISQICNNSLKEYLDGRVGIAAIEVVNDDYKKRIQDVLNHANKLPYELYVFMVFRQDTQETVVYYRDQKRGRFPSIRHFDALISRSHNVVPEVLDVLKA